MNAILESSDSRIAEFITMRDHVLNNRNLFIAETEKVFLQYRASKRPIHKILATREFLERHGLSGENIFYADSSVLEQVAGFKIYFEVLFLAEIPADVPLNKLDNKIIVLNGLSSPENVGSIVRSAAAFEINSIITDERTCSPFLRRCIRVSTGNVFAMKTFHAADIKSDLRKLSQLGYKIYSTANIAGAIDLQQFTFPEKYVVIIGSEGHGVDPDILQMSDQVLKIRINAQVAHLNASNAASIFLSRMSNL